MGCPSQLREQILAKLRQPSPALQPRRTTAPIQPAESIPHDDATFTVASPPTSPGSSHALETGLDLTTVTHPPVPTPGSFTVAHETPPDFARTAREVATDLEAAAVADVQHVQTGAQAFTVAQPAALQAQEARPGTGEHSRLYGGPPPTHAAPGKATVVIPPSPLTVAPSTVSRSSSPPAFTVASPPRAELQRDARPTVFTVAQPTVNTASSARTDPDPDGEEPDDDRVDGDEPFEVLFQRLTHVTLARVETTFSNEYAGEFHVVTPAMLRSHFAGEISLGFAVLEDGSSRGDALFGGLDVDRDFPRRLPVLRRAVAAVGGEALVDASFATTGSDLGRGKIVVTLERPGSAADVRALMTAIKNAALRDPAFGHMTSPGEIELRPLAGTGGLLRILGRNRGKDRPGFKAPIERPLTLDGELAFLGDVVPLPIARLRAIAAAHRERNNDRYAWVSAWLSEAWTYRPEERNTQGIFRRMVALANAAVERFGAGDVGSVQFRAWCAQVAAHSPALDQPSPTNKDERNPLRHEPTIARAWRYAATRDTRWQPLDLVGSGLPEGQIRVYRVLADFMHSRALAPEMFAMNYNFLTTELLGGICHKKTVWKQVQALVKRGCIVIHDQGMPMRRDERGEYRAGLPTILGLVGKGQTPADVLAAVQGNPRHYQRIAKRERDRVRLLEPKRTAPAARRAVG